MRSDLSVSVIVPVHNGELYLADALESVLAQTPSPLEVLVVDDGSTDSTADVAARFGTRVTYYYQEQAGAAAARNRGVETSRGELLAFIDADDVWTESKLARQLEALDGAHEAVFGLVEHFYSPDLDEDMRRTLVLPAESKPGLVPGAMLIRRESFLRIGRFGESWAIGEFVDWYARGMEEGLRCLTLPEVVLRRRIHAANQGVLKRERRADDVRIVRAALDRRRHLR